ncbi:MAG: hypothetical protein WC718_14760, partial [Phycisphaerales bacterium]
VLGITIAAVIVLAITVAVLFAYPSVRHAVGGVHGGEKEAPEPPSQTLPGAPGPDNTATTLPPAQGESNEKLKPTPPPPSPRENN